MKNFRGLHPLLMTGSFLVLCACGAQDTTILKDAQTEHPPLSQEYFPNRTLRSLFQDRACASRIFHVNTNVIPDPKSDLTAKEEMTTFQVNESNRKVNAYWMASASALAYDEAPHIQDELKTYWGAKNVAFFEKHQRHPLLDVQAFVADIPHDSRYDIPAHSLGAGDAAIGEAARVSVGDMTIVAFRGTEVRVIADVKTDLRDTAVPMPAGRVTLGHVHRGFLESLDAVWDGVFAEAKRAKRPVWVTGHSLGSALATLFAARVMALHDPDVRIAGLYTYGSPRVGLKDFVKTFNKLAAKDQIVLRRYVNNNDPVTIVPDKVTGILGNGFWHSLLTGWQHVGLGNSERDAVVWYQDDRAFLNAEALEYMPSSIWKFLKGDKGIKDHKPEAYVDRTEKDAFGSSSPCAGALVSQE